MVGFPGLKTGFFSFLWGWYNIDPDCVGDLGLGDDLNAGVIGFGRDIPGLGLAFAGWVWFMVFWGVGWWFWGSGLAFSRHCIMPILADCGGLGFPGFDCGWCDRLVVLICLFWTWF